MKNNGDCEKDRVCVVLPKSLLAKIDEKCSRTRRHRSNYLQLLVEADLERDKPEQQTEFCFKLG